MSWSTESIVQSCGPNNDIKQLTTTPSLLISSVRVRWQRCDTYPPLRRMSIDDENCSIVKEMSMKKSKQNISHEQHEIVPNDYNAMAQVQVEDVEVLVEKCEETPSLPTSSQIVDIQPVIQSNCLVPTHSTLNGGHNINTTTLTKSTNVTDHVHNNTSYYLTTSSLRYARQYRVLGFLQVLSGSLLFLIQVGYLAFLPVALNIRPSLGIWSGITFMAAGLLGILTAKRRSQCLVFTSLMLNISAVCAALGGGALSAYEATLLLTLVNSRLPARNSHLGKDAVFVGLCLLTFAVSLVECIVCCISQNSSCCQSGSRQSSTRCCSLWYRKCSACCCTYVSNSEQHNTASTNRRDRDEKHNQEDSCLLLARRNSDFHDQFLK